MAATNQNSPVGFEAFRRYQNGQMSAKEQHDLERLMLEDPLVAEAYEGFLKMAASGQEQITTALSEALHNRISTKERRAIPIWMYAAAASVMVSLGVYWLVFLSDRQESHRVSSEMLTELPKLAPKQEVGPDIQSKTAPSHPEADKEVEIKAPAAVGSVPQVQETNAEPQKLEEAILADEKEEQFAVAETAPAAAIPAPAVAVPAGPPASQLLSKQATAKMKADPDHAGSAIAKPKANGTTSATDSIASPISGWKAYQIYLDKNTISESEGAEVTVYFKVNADGSLTEFHAKGNQANLFNRAIRIVKEGPSWQPARINGFGKASQQQIMLHFHTTK